MGMHFRVDSFGGFSQTCPALRILLSASLYVNYHDSTGENIMPSMAIISQSGDIVQRDIGLG